MASSFSKLYLHSNSLLLFFSKKGGDLESKIKKAKNENKPFSVEVIEEWSKQLITGLEFIHRHNIIHRDIKPAFEF